MLYANKLALPSIILLFVIICAFAFRIPLDEHSAGRMSFFYLIFSWIIIFIPGLALAAIFSNSNIDKYIIILIGTGISSMLNFWAFFISPYVGWITAFIIIFLSIASVCARGLKLGSGLIDRARR